MRAAAETLYIGRIGRGGAGLLGVGPGFLIRRLAGRFVERDDALTCLRHVRAGAEVLQICRIGCGGAGLLGIGPGLLVGLLARLIISRRLLLLLCLLRIRGLAASRRQRSPDNDDCNDRQFRKCGAPYAPGLLIQISAHAWPLPSLLHPRRGQALVARPSPQHNDYSHDHPPTAAQMSSSAGGSSCWTAHKTLARRASDGLSIRPNRPCGLSVAKISRANDESGDFLFDRRAFLSQSQGRFNRWSSSNSYGCCMGAAKKGEN